MKAWFKSRRHSEEASPESIASLTARIAQLEETLRQQQIAAAESEASLQQANADLALYILEVEAANTEVAADGQSALSMGNGTWGDREKAEEALHKSEEENRFLADLLERSDLAFGVGYPDGRLGKINEAFERLTGYSREELQAMNWAEVLTPPEWREIERDRLEELRRTGQPVRYEKEYLRKDGSRVPIELLVHLRRNDAGEPAFYYSFLTDLTERKRAEEAMQESEAQFRVLSNAIPQLCWMANADGGIFWYNQRWYEYTGTTPEQMEGWGWQAVHDPDALPKVLDRWRASIATGEPFDMVFPLRGADGSFRPFLTRVMPLRDDDGKVVRWFGTNTDITEQKRAEEDLRASEERFRVLSEAMPQIVWSADAAGTVDYYNPQALEYAGVRLEDLQGWSWVAFIHPDDLAPTESTWRRALVAGRVDQIEHRLRRADGEFRWHLTRAVPVRNGKGEVIRWIGSATDIHDQKAAAQDLERRVAERTAELARSMSLLETVTSNAPVVLFATDAQGVFTLATGKGLSAAGRQPGKIIGKHYREALSDNPQGQSCIERALNGESFTAIVKAPNGNVFETLYNPVRDGEGKIAGIIGVSVDITERKRAEEELRESQALTRLIVDSTSDLIWSVDSERFALLTFNLGIKEHFLRRGVCLQTGMHPEEIFTDRGLVDRWRGIYQRALAEGPSVFDYHSPTAGYLQLTVNLLTRDGKVIGISIFGKDITESKRAEEKLLRLNRSLKTISECNQVMVAAQDETTLLQDICRIMVEDGGYRLVWVGYAEQDEARTVRPVAQAGTDDGYLAQARISWADNERGRGPTGKAIRCGATCVARKTLVEPDYEPWRAEAQRRGFASSVALPLFLDSHPMGALTLYCGEPDGFDDDELKLLIELANDLAFGIHALRTRAERRQAEERLRKEEEKYRTLFNSIDEGFCTIEVLFDENNKAVDFRYLEVNPAFEKQTGIRNAQGKRIREIAPQLEEYWFEIYGKVALTGEPARFEDYAAYFQRWFQIDAFRTGEPQQKKVAVLFNDITERKRADESVRKVSAETQDLYNRAPCGYHSIDKDGVVLRMNETELRWLGYSSEEVVGKLNINDLLTEKSREVFGESFPKFKETGLIQDLEMELIRQDGSVLPVIINATTVRDDDGNYVMSRSTVFDMTERKRALQALQESQQRLDLALESGEMGAWDLDLIHNTAVRSLRHDQIFGYFTLQPEWSTEIFFGHVVPRDREKVRAAFEKAYAGDLLDFECQITRTDGCLRWIAARGLVRRDSQGNPARMYGMVADVTERKRAEQEIRRLNESLEQRVRERTADLQAANQELQAFTYSVSHDLRAPLRHIDGFSKLLEEVHREQLPGEAQHYLRNIRNAARRMGEMVDDLLSLSRVTRQELCLQITGLNSLVEEVRRELQPEAAGRDIEWKIGPLPFLECDAGLIKHVLANLISNAVKFTRRCEHAVIEVGSTLQDGSYVIFVRDNGAGFSMKNSSKLFGAFQRLHRQEDFEGTGVGLATVQRIVHKHGGRVWAEAEMNQGATFYFTLGSAESQSDEKLNLQ